MMCLLTFQKKHIVWKSLKISHLILAFSFNICPIKIDLYINTVWLQALRFSKTRQIDYFDISNKHSKYEHIAHLAGNVEWDFFCDFQTSREMEIFPPIFLSCQRRVRVCVSQECCCCCISAALGGLHLLVLQFFSFFFSSDGALEPPTTSSLLVDGEKVSAANTHTHSHFPTDIAKVEPRKEGKQGANELGSASCCWWSLKRKTWNVKEVKI